MVTDCQGGDAAKGGRAPPLLRAIRFCGVEPLEEAESAREIRRGPSAARLCPKRGHNERHNYSYVTAADLAGSVRIILTELGVRW